MHEMLTVWEKKRIEFFAKHPKCKICGGGFNHYSRNMICRKCQITIYRERAKTREPGRSREYRKKHKEKIKAYQARYYLVNRETISEQKKIKYQKKGVKRMICKCQRFKEAIKNGEFKEAIYPSGKEYYLSVIEGIESRVYFCCWCGGEL